MERKTKRTGRKTLSDQQRNRATEQKKESFVLMNYCFNLLLTLMRMDNSLCINSHQTEEENISPENVLQTDQISTFIDNERWFFIKMLTIMINGNHQSIQIVDQTNYLNEAVPRSFFFGLIQLRKSQGLQGQDVWLSLSKTQLKIIYIISIILQGIAHIDQSFWQIDFQSLPQNSQEAIYVLFEEIVQRLLQHTKLLTRNIFDKLVQFWDMSITSVEQELTTQQSYIQSSLNYQRVKPFPIPSVQELRGLFQARVQEFQKQKIVQQNFEKEEKRQVNRMNGEKPHIMIGKDIQRDHSPFLDDVDDYSENFYPFWKNEEKRTITPEPLNNCIPIKNPQSNIISRAMKQQNAQENYNWNQKYTRCRTQRANRQRREERLNQMRNRHQIQEYDPKQVDQIYSVLTLRNNSHVQAEGQIVNHQPQLLEQVNPNIPNPAPQRTPYHEIRHENREVDAIIDELMDNDLAIAQSMANHIYHSLVTYKIKFLNFQ